MRSDVTFDAEGTTLRGWLYLPEQGREPFPLVVMAHGWAGVKEEKSRYALFVNDDFGGLNDRGHLISHLQAQLLG